MTKPAVVFDLGKVLVDFDYGIACQKITALSSISYPEVQDFLGASPLLSSYESGQMSSLEFFHGVCARTGFRGSFEEFAGYFADIFSPIPAMIDFHARLRASGIPTYVFSNTNELAVKHIRKDFPFFANFDGYIFSFQHRAMKPNSRLYEVVEKAAGCKGEQIIYIDDRLENVEAGMARGWRGIHHQTPEMTFANVKGLGLPV